MDATQYPGADMCAKITAAANVLNKANPYGGTVDAQGFTGVQACTHNVNAGCPNTQGFYTVKLGGVRITTTVQQVIPQGTRIIAAPGFGEYSNGAGTII